MLPVKPLHKKTDRTSYTSYRPISLLTTYSKPLDYKVMYNGLMQHMHHNNKLVPEQIHFRKDISTEQAAYKLDENAL
jgi:hypothetical protein